MISVAIQPEPGDFHNKVRERGAKFLSKVVNPTQNQWDSHSYWRDISSELYDAYKGICSFSCHWIPPDTGWKSIEHFKPKSKYPKQAYEWSNLRLVCGTLNGRKKDFEDVVDPFDNIEGWFILIFPTLIVKPNPELDDTKRKLIESTIDRLKLNDPSTCLQGRQHWLSSYLKGDISFNHLTKMAPFIANEFIRQDLQAKLRKEL